MSLENKVAIVTGASRGIGKAIALRLAQERARVVVAAKTVEPNPKLPGTIHDTVREICEARGEAMAVRCDVRRHEDLDRLVAETLSTFGRIDILVNNAGVIWIQPLSLTDEKRLDLLLDINFKAPFLLSRLCIPHMAKNGWGHIINMSPPIREEHLTYAAEKIGYMASKINMTLLTHGLAGELKGTGIACNSLWPRTLIESLATINLGLGRPDDWRRSDILVDAVALILHQDPNVYTGQALIDEDVLRDCGGIQDFRRYNVVPDSQPRLMDWALFDQLIEEAKGRFRASS